MSFLEEIKNALGIDLSAEAYRITVLGEKGAYFENVKCIKYYGEKEVALLLHKGELLVKGENLIIKKYCAGDVAVCGKITAIEKK